MDLTVNDSTTDTPRDYYIKITQRVNARLNPRIYMEFCGLFFYCENGLQLCQNRAEVRVK